MLGLHVVSPLWIEQCRESGKRWPEAEFAVGSITQANSTPLYWGDSSLASSSIASTTKQGSIATKSNQKSKSTESVRPKDPLVKAIIPLPSFKLASFKPLPAEMETLRRSDRICDLGPDDDDDSDDGGDQAVHEMAEDVSLDDVMKIDPYKPMKVFLV